MVELEKVPSVQGPSSREIPSFKIQKVEPRMDAGAETEKFRAAEPDGTGQAGSLQHSMLGSLRYKDSAGIRGLKSALRV